MNHTVKKWVLIACLAAISYLLMFISFAVIPLVPYMKVDFSDLAVLIGFFILKTKGGLNIALIRSLLYFLITGLSLDNFIGVATSFCATIAFCLPMYLVLRTKPKKMLLAVVLATFSLTTILSFANWLVITPVYMAVLGMKLSLPLAQLILYGVVPFNLIKGILVGVAFSLVYNRLVAWLTLKQKNFA